MSLLESCCIYHENGNCNKGKHCVFFSFRKGQSWRRQEEDKDRINFYRHYRQRVGDPTQPVLHEKIKVRSIRPQHHVFSSRKERTLHALVFSERKNCKDWAEYLATKRKGRFWDAQLKFFRRR